MNKFRCLLVFAAASFSGALPLAAQSGAPVAVPPPPAARLSPHETISLHVGTGRNAPLVTITYGRPLSKKVGTTEVRKIWGTLVPWGAVWRMGSDEATTLITQEPLDFDGTTVPAGAYTLCMFPDDKGTTKLIINKQIGQWGIPYTPAIQANELARVDMKKDTLDTQVDEFTIALVADPATGGGIIKAFWETTQYSVGFTLKK
jgi:hypothetical protein